MNGIAMTISRRIEAIKTLAAERGESHPAGEIARQFQLLCERSSLHSGPLSTRHMLLLAADLVPEATARLYEVQQHAA